MGAHVRSVQAVAAAVVVSLFIGACGPTASAPVPTVTVTVTRTAQPHPTGQSPTRTAPTGTSRATATPPAPTPATTVTVTRIVDGDTIEVSNGETVRLIGIDTPEVGECGFERAARALGRLALGRTATLAEGSPDDRDRYGRLLRYVDVGNTDAGLELIRRGLAISRYDSRDGYGHHPREESYIAADRGSVVCRS